MRLLLKKLCVILFFIKNICIGSLGKFSMILVLKFQLKIVILQALSIDLELIDEQKLAVVNLQQML